MRHKSGGVTIREVQRMVRELEEVKGFNKGYDRNTLLGRKIIWMVEEVGELVHAYKHNDEAKMAEEAIDVLFFVAGILNIIGVDGTMVFLDKLAKNHQREPVNSKNEFHFDKK
jgi:NTP pyrophosphatase (non-canonical NTP hydrolase)